MIIPKNERIPKNVVNKKLYLKIKQRIRRSVKKTGRRWGAYDSGRLVREYKNSGGRYSPRKVRSSLNRWYAEKWIDACAWPKIRSCGRKKMTTKLTYCRPLKRITNKTPRTVKELSKRELKTRCNRKYANPRRIVR